MIFQIEQLFVNTDNIVTISPLDRPALTKDNKEVVELGIVINGVKYTLFVVEKENEKLQELRQKVVNVVTTIINGISIHAVQKLNLGEKDE